MSSIRKVWATLTVGAAMLAGSAGVVSAQDAAQGYFTAEQAANGEAVFNANCSQCHGKNLQGVEAPGLTGPDVMGTWGTAQGMFGYFSVAMPPTAPGKLDKASYLAIMAHILDFNGAPAGTHELTEADLPNIDLVAVTKGGASAAPDTSAASSSAEAPSVPQAFTHGKDLPSVSSSSAPAAAAPSSSEQPAQPTVPQAFTHGKALPTVSSSSAAPTPASSSEQPAETSVPQAFTHGKDLPTVSSSASSAPQ